MIGIAPSQSNLDNLTALVGKANPDAIDMAEIHKRAAQAAKDIAQAHWELNKPNLPHNTREWQRQLDEALEKAKL